MLDFFLAGGYGMYAVSAFGFALVGASVLYALRPGPRFQRLVLVLGIATFMTGLLGTASGISLSAHYIHQVAAEKQLGIFAMGIDESLHNVVLALILVVLASTIFAVGCVGCPGHPPLRPRGEHGTGGTAAHIESDALLSSMASASARSSTEIVE